jgi:hypothetical protein
MRGVVSGSPYGASNGQIAIPVLFSKQTLRSSGLKSPVGVVILKRADQVKLPNGAGYTTAVNMRTGDRFKGVGDVGSLQKRVYYPRVVFRKATVYFRSKEMSLAELTIAVNALQKALTQLTAQVNALQAGTIKAFKDVYAQLADLRNQLASLKLPAGVDLSSLQAQIDSLTQTLTGLISGLPDFDLFALKSQLPDLTSYAHLSDVSSMISGAIAGLNLSQFAQASDLLAANAQIASLTSKLNTVCGVLKAATVTLDPDGGGLLPPVTVPVSLPGITGAGACGP